jgi:DNA polymerase I-like protein with 3'-5' exonuclease and polymerase domains
MRTKTQILTTKAEVRQLIKACKQVGYCCYDWETNGQPIYMKDFCTTILSITFQAGFACSVVTDHFQRKEYKVRYSSKWVIKKIGHELIENPEVVKMAWNHKFDGQIFQKYHIYYRGTVIDGMLAKYVLNEEKPNGLKDMTRRYLPEYGNYESEKGFDKIPWDQKPLDQLCQYGGQDTDYTFRLCIFFEKKLIDLGLYDLFRNLIMPASRVLQSVEANGLYIDREFNEKLLEEYKKKIDKALDNILNLPRVKRFHKYLVEQRVEKYIGKVQDEIDKLNDEYKAARGEKDSAKIRASIEKKIASREQKIVNVRMGIYNTKGERELEKPINLGSPVDLPLLVYDEHGFGFECTEFTDTGNPSTAEDTLQQLRLTVKKPDNPKAIFLDNLLDLRGLQKMYTTFIEGWHDKTQDDNKLHGSFKIHGTTSGRLSSSEPNLQQIPKTSVDPNIKKQLVAAPGTLYISSDFSQAELRIMAHLSGDETYLQAFASGNDPHLAIACKKYHVPYEEILPIYKDEKHPDHKMWSVRRKQAKQLAFGLIYGIGPALLAVKLSDPKSGIIVTKEEAKQQMDEYFAEHPALQKFKAKQERILKKQGFIKSLFGRKRRLPQIWSDNHDEQAYAIRLGLNFPCQSAASDMCLFGSILIYYLMRQGKLPMMNSVTLVHDANYFNAVPETINTWDLYEMWKIFSNPSTKKYFGFQIDDVLMDMDYHVGRTMAEELPFIPGYDYRKMLEPDFDVDEYMKEAKKYGDIPISDYPKHFAKQMKKYEEDFKAGKY